jgi:hypothetical protein
MAFTCLTNRLRVTDYFKFSDPLLFSWDNKRQQGTRSLLRLDRFYCFPNPIGSSDSHIKAYTILGNDGLSDHLVVELKLEFNPNQPKGSRYKMNAAYL